MTFINDVKVLQANASHTCFSLAICQEMESSAKVRGTGIAKRTPAYISQKMEEGKAVIALHKNGNWVGFCYIETWQGEYVANSGLIVIPSYRNSGVAARIKKKIFELSRARYPQAKIFGLTTGLAVMKINSELGYKPVTYSELTKDQVFWEGCKSCVNYEILQAKEQKNCLCTAMLFDPQKNEKERRKRQEEFTKKESLYGRFIELKKRKLLNWIDKLKKNKHEK